MSSTAAPATIGIATLETDGAVVLKLRADGTGGTVGDGQFRYPPNSSQYEMIRKHVGTIPAHGSVPVKPFAEN